MQFFFNISIVVLNNYLPMKIFNNFMRLCWNSLSNKNIYQKLLQPHITNSYIFFEILTYSYGKTMWSKENLKTNRVYDTFPLKNMWRLWIFYWKKNYGRCNVSGSSIISPTKSVIRLTSNYFNVPHKLVCLRVLM